MQEDTPTLQRPGINVIDVNYMHQADKNEGSRCGYCKNEKPNSGNASWGIGTPRLSAADYQLLMDRGWRRCGTYTYKFDLNKSCCQPFCIRLDVNEFEISQS